MTDKAHDVDQIVREVIRRLSDPGSAPEKNSLEGNLVIEPQVVSLALVEKRLHGVRQITVRPGAVVTPAVRDLLRQEKIALRFVARQESGSPTRTVVGLANTSFDASCVLSDLSEVANVQPVSQTGFENVIQETAQHVDGGDGLGILLTGSPYLAVCLANRLDQVRAIHVSNLFEMQEAIPSAEANLLVLDPTRVGSIEMKKMLETFCRDARPSPSCAGLKKA